jgi:hypothetical protein
MSIRVETTVTGPGPGELDQKLRQITRAAFIELFGRYQASFNPPAWSWPRKTRRRVGVVGSPRNIVDLGALRQSGTYTFPDAYSIEARWSADYATAKHEGARLRNGTILPATPWTDAVRGTVQASGIPAYPLGQKLQQRIQVAVARG